MIRIKKELVTIKKYYYIYIKPIDVFLFSFYPLLAIIYNIVKNKGNNFNNLIY